MPRHTKLAAGVPRDEYEKKLEEIRQYRGGVEYIGYRLRGASEKLALELSGVKRGELSTWRNGKFRQIEEELLEGGGGEAEAAARREVGIKAEVLLEKLIERGVRDWEKLKKEERGQVMRAIELIKKAGGKRSTESYEDSIHRMRKEG